MVSNKKPRRENVLGDAHEDFIFEQRRLGVSYRKITQRLIETEEFPDIRSLHHDTVFEYFKKRIEQYQADLLNLKSVRSANAKCRLSELEQVKDKFRDRLIEFLGLSARDLKELQISFLVSQYVNLMDQIRTECGDKAKDKNGEPHKQTVIHIINTIPGMFADGDKRNPSAENTAARSGFRLDRI